MEDGGGGGGTLVAAPFIVKTYRMVNDPATDPVIAWGRDNNSFVVVDPFAFCQALLPAHFKHGNFSSFVRQLNTYGFRKVDPDRWEFAHQLFLRGQAHLLRQIVRRNSGKSGGGGRRREEEEGEDAAAEERVVTEMVRLREEQQATEEELQRMGRRVTEAERRPKQMQAFLVRVLGDPQMLHRLMGEDTGVTKRARLMIEAERKNASPSPPPPAETTSLGCEGFMEYSSEGTSGLFDINNQFTTTVDPVESAAAPAYDFVVGDVIGRGGAGGGLYRNYPLTFTVEEHEFE